MYELDNIDFRWPAEVIFRADEKWVYGREPVLRRMPDGSLLSTVYSGGPTEPHNENVVLIVRGNADGTQWSKPQLLFEHAERGVWATELFTGGACPFMAVHSLDAESHYMDIHTYLSFTDDSGETWSEPASLPGGLHDVIIRQGLVLQDGSWLFPVYWQEALIGGGNLKTHKPSLSERFAVPGKPINVDDSKARIATRRFRCGALRSEGGNGWSLHGYIKADCNLREPNVAEIAPGHLVMLMRAEGVNRKYRSESLDAGLTWSIPEKTEIPDVNSKITLLQHDGRVLMLHNPSETCGWTNRKSLELWVSDDGMSTWKSKVVIAYADSGVICYPHGFIDAAEGLLYLALDSAAAHYLMKAPLSEIV